MRRVTNIAHRGARSLAPENTLAAARKGLEAGADLWEIDVAVTKDGALILMHDDLLGRTTDVKTRFPERAFYPFTTFTLEEVRTLDAGSWFIADDPHGQIKAGLVSTDDQKRYPGERIPTLREALEFTHRENWAINIELKRLPAGGEDFPVVDKVLAVINDSGIDPRRVVLSSARHDWLDDARKRRPEIPLQAIMGLLPSDSMDFGDRRFRTYNIRITRTNVEEVRELTASGHDVNLYVVNEVDDMQRFVDAGAAGLITDFPQKLAYLMESPA